jgi:hypothetical protein
MSNPNFNALATTTLQKYLPKMADNIFKSRAFYFWLTSKGRKKDYQGGRTIVAPLEYGQAGGWATYSGYDAITLTAAQTDSFTAAEFGWKQAVIPVAINGLEEAQNSGEQALLDLLEAKIKAAEKTAQEKFNEMAITGVGTTTTWNGLANIVADNSGNIASVTGATITTGFGGIDNTSSAYWRSIMDRNGSVDKALSIADMSKQYNLQTVGNDSPDFILTTSTLWEKYEALLQPQQRFTDAKMAEAGFQNLLYKRAPVTWDEYVPAKAMYMLNSEYLWLATLAGNWMKMRGFVEPEGQDAKFALITCYGNLVTNNRRMQGALSFRIP